MVELLNSIQSILSAPFVGDLDLYHLFALVGIVLLMIIAWVFIIHTISATASEI